MNMLLTLCLQASYRFTPTICLVLRFYDIQYTVVVLDPQYFGLYNLVQKVTMKKRLIYRTYLQSESDSLLINISENDKQRQ